MGNRDFDFLFGRWKVRNRRLQERLASCGEWIEFEAGFVARPLWDGAANIDEFTARGTPLGDIDGMTLRLYDETSRQWVIYWANRTSGRLDTPMFGEWKNGVGEFYDQELFHGRMIYARFLWTNPSPSTARWEQAYSDDGGRTWEMNWVMDLERLP